jgi:hypothetical protein
MAAPQCSTMSVARDSVAMSSPDAVMRPVPISMWRQLEAALADVVWNPGRLLRLSWPWLAADEVGIALFTLMSTLLLVPHLIGSAPLASLASRAYALLGDDVRI